MGNTQNELDQKRAAIKEIYPNMKVDKMKDKQVIAIYLALKTRGKLR